jgi:cystathionine beta-lyase/cystathionine gamma-synthase
LFVSGQRGPPEGMGAGLVYSRFKHPNSEIVEDRLSVYERTDKCALFSSGMSVIAITIIAFHVLVRHRRRSGYRVQFLNALQIFKLAVSLGGTEPLASLPASMTHSGVPAEVRHKNRDSRLNDSAFDRDRASVRFDCGHRPSFGY